VKLLPKRLVYSLAGLTLGVSVYVSAPAFARSGSDDSITGNTSSSETSGNSSTESSNKTESEIEIHNSALVEQLKEKAHEQLQAKREQTKARTQEVRQKTCEARKASLDKRMSRLVTQAEKHKSVFDSIYVKVKNFHDSKQLSVANYDTLTVKVDSAQANAAAKIVTLKALDIQVDCTQTNVADSVGAFRQAVSDTRDTLKTYRTALKDLISALHGASESAKQSDSTN